jgi:hypothetical protein
MDTWLKEAAARVATAWLDAGGRERLLAAAPATRPFRSAPAVGAEALPATRATLDPRVEIVVRDLFLEAFTNGLVRVPEFQAQYELPSAGSTAELVVKSTLAMAFFVKVDDEPKLAEEARKLQAVHARADIPQEVRDCFPHVYAAKLDGPPFGYVMESFSGFVGFEKVCFAPTPDDAQVRRAGDRALDLLLSAYESSRTGLFKPNLRTIYLDRITSRLAEASRLSADLESLVSQGAVINDTECLPPSEYVSRLAGQLAGIEPAFSTFVHGDAHPENILVRISPTKVDVKFIDPKDWPLGDYLFDVGKLLHYLEVTGPAERLEKAPTVTIDASKRALTYTLARSAQVDRLGTDVRARIAAFAKDVGDQSWKERLSLSIASNLLGLPAGRWAAGKRDSAFITFGEGLLWLRRATEEIGARLAVPAAGGTAP